MSTAPDGTSPVSAVTGLRIRPYAGEADIPGLVDVSNAEFAADHVDERLTVAGERAWLSNASDQFDPSRDVAIAEIDGRVVAVIHRNWADSRDGTVREYRLSGVVEPSFRGRGIGRALLAENERQARALAATHATERPRVFTGFVSQGRPGERLLLRAGYEPVRWFIDMVRPTLDDLPAVDAPLPPGLELRPVAPDQYPTIWRANREAFRDHWGGSDESEAAMRRFLEAPDADPSLWLIAWDGEEVAGGVINTIHAAENESLGLRRGWLDSVFTRRRWRRRGLARALILRSMRLLRERGMTSAALGVDADNEQGALGLYEGAGFAVHDRLAAYRKPLDAG